MANSVTKLPDAPIIIFACTPGASPVPDLLPTISALRRLLDQQPEPVFLITDTRGMVLDVADMLAAARIGARGRDAVLHHPMIRENVYVIVDPMMKMALKALAGPTFGFVRLSSFETLDQALDHCYEKLGIAGRT
jgi:hypothetical protein